jgi:type II secretory pathway component GspD/PulD (secretin)
MRHQILLVLLGLALVASAQAQLEKKVTIRARDQKISRVLQTLCKVAGLNLIHSPELDTKRVSLDLKDIQVGRLMRYLAALHGFGLTTTSDGLTVLAGSKVAIASMVPYDVRVVPMANGSAEKNATTLQRVYKGKVQAIADPRTNSVILVTGDSP